MNLVVQAGTRAAAELRVRTATKWKIAMQQFDGPPNRIGRCKGTHIKGPIGPEPPYELDGGKGVSCVDTDTEIALVILQVHIVSWSVALDKGVL